MRHDDVRLDDVRLPTRLNEPTRLNGCLQGLMSMRKGRNKVKGAIIRLVQQMIKGLCLIICCTDCLLHHVGVVERTLEGVVKRD